MNPDYPKILFCPAHFVFDEISRGSELAWSFSIANKISNTYTGSVVVTGFKNLRSKKKYRIVELTPKTRTIDLGILSSLIFNLKYTFYSFFLLQKESFAIHHHLLPFSIGRTFNLFRVMGFKGSKKFIIGPIQSPLPEYEDNIHDFSNKTQNNVVTHFIKKNVNSLSKNILEWLSKKTILSADALIAIDEKTKATLVKLGVDKSKVQIITPGVETSIFKKTTKKNSEKIQLLTVSYLISRKNIPSILKALTIVKKKTSDFVLHIVGDGPQLEKLKTISKSLDLDNHIIFHGFIDNSKVAAMYAEADIFVTMSKHESWGQMYLEAMSSQLPIISYPNSGAKTILKSDFSFMASTSEELAKKILQLINNHKKITKMGSEARKIAIARYDWDTTIIPQYKLLYTKLLQ
jgi:glycosyltransferase involved in cell wall biosynthesis